MISFTIPNISYGDHIGGLIGGGLAILAFHAADRRRVPAVAYAACGLIAVASVAAAIGLASTITP